jgi:hypothetical protein
MQLLWAVGATTVDPTTVSLVSLIATLGPTAGSIVVLYFCLAYMKNRDDKDREANAEVQKALRDLINQQGDVMREFTKAANGICRFTAVGTNRRHAE